ncbi:MAG TPA: N-acetylmuramoyl-L-alanine amidase [Nocardioides sp.]|nr:N-acetylmuramoyl-L-alanine amidase [Nocardioides sp.]
MLSCTRPGTLSTAAAALALTGALVAGPPLADAAPAPTPGARPDLRLAAPPGQVVRSATVRLGADRLQPTRSGGRTDRLSTTTYSMVGFTWRGPNPDVTLRTRTAGKWTPWRSVPPLTDGRAAGGRSASSLLWVDRSHGIQVRTSRQTPEALQLVLIDPGVLPSDSAASDPADATTARPRAGAIGAAPQPELHTRKEWGADPSWRNGSPVYTHRLKQIHVHHTATGNDYSQADVPGILRGIYRYHTQTLGWFDVGYNFLVDRFGRAWVGRSGGVNRLVRGAHTLGFNEHSVGIAVIGNLARRAPWPEAVTAIVKLAAWKLDAHGRDALGSVTVTSTGSDKYPNGTTVRLPVIDGHRDTNDTECPGRAYGQLPEIRDRAQWRIDHW